MKRTNEIVKHFIENYPVIYQDMHKCYHQKDLASVNPFHIENDVWAHTLLVMQVARRRYPGKFLNKLACLCHDFGKPLARQISDKGRVCFFRHESLSNFVAVDFLNDPVFGLNHQEKIQIHEMINYHLKIWDLFEYSDAVKTKGKRVIGNKVRLNYKGHDIFDTTPQSFKNLITLLECDEQGRICIDQMTKEFYRNLKLVHYNMDKLPFKEHKVCTNKITLLIGPPCSGKSHFRDKNVKDEVIISRDDTLMKYSKEQSNNNNISYTEAFKQYGNDSNVDKDLQKLYNEAIKNNKNIIVDMTNMSTKSRRKWLQVPVSYQKEAIVFMVDHEVLKERNLERSKVGKNIPDHVMTDMMKSFVVPLPNEFDTIHWEFFNNKERY